MRAGERIVKDQNQLLGFDPVIQNDRIRIVPDHISQIGITSNYLCCNPACEQTRPTQNYKSPMQWCTE